MQSIRDCSGAFSKALFIQLLKTYSAVIKTSLKTCNKWVAKNSTCDRESKVDEQAILSWAKLKNCMKLPLHSYSRSERASRYEKLARSGDENFPHADQVRQDRKSTEKFFIPHAFATTGRPNKWSRKTIFTTRVASSRDRRARKTRSQPIKSPKKCSFHRQERRAAEFVPKIS